MIKFNTPICPHCNTEMILLTTERFAKKDGEERKFWGCRNFPSCKSSIGAHSNGKPMGFPAPDQATSDARKLAHEVFDRLWKRYRVRRENAYEKLANMMGIYKEKCHIAMFDEKQCYRFIELSKQWERTLKTRKSKGKMRHRENLKRRK